MMTMVQRLDAGSFFLDPLFSVFIFLALVLKPECGRTSSFQTVQFWSLADNSWVAKKRGWVQPIAGLDPSILDRL